MRLLRRSSYNDGRAAFSRFTFQFDVSPFYPQKPQLPMKSIFNKKFEKEFLLNERLRTTILVCVFLTAMIVTAINLFIFKNTGTEELNKDSLRLILFFQGCLLAFE